MIRLEPPGRCWRVLGGEAGVFGVPVAGGRRQLLFTVGVGGHLVGTAPAGGWAFVAAPLSPWTVEDAGTASIEALRVWRASMGQAAGVGPAGLQVLDAVAAALDDRAQAQDRSLDAARAERAAEAGRGSAPVRSTVARIAGLPDAAQVDAEHSLPRVFTQVVEAMGLRVAPPRTVSSSSPTEALDRLAREAGLRVRRVSLDGAWWREPGPPLIAWAQDGPVALLADARGGTVCWRPAGGRQTVDASVASTLPDEAFELVRRLPTRALETLDLLRFGMVGTGADLARAVTWSLAATALGASLPIATGLLIDQVIPDSDAVALRTLGAGLLVLVLCASLLRWAQLVAMQRLGGQVASAAQMALWDRLVRLPVSALRPFAVGEQLAQVRSVTAASALLTGSTLQGALGGLLGLANLGVMAWYNVRLSVVAALIGVVSVALTAGPATEARSASLALVAERARVQSRTLQLLGAVGKLQAAGAVDTALAWWWSSYEAQLRHQWRLWLARGRLALLQIAVPMLAAAAVFVVGAEQHALGAMSAGDFVAFNATFVIFLGAVGTLVGAVVDLGGARAEVERAAPLLAAVPEVRPGATHPGVLRGGLWVDKVGFRYRPDAPPVLEGLSLRVEPGEFVAIVGGSGSGKSTLLRLLLGFETPQQGRVFYDGQDLAGLDLEALRRQLGVVLQNGRVSAGTVHEAVAGAHPATQAQVWEALEAATLRAEVEAFPMGLHTQVGDGGSLLSGGQRQRLLIARALLGRPKILLLDEATSALDNRAQAIVSEHLRQLKVTRIVIAHRLSTVREADRIVVLEGGRVAQSGTFGELAEVEGPFRELVARQRV